MMRLTLTVSVVLNAVLSLALFNYLITGAPTTPDGRLGALTKDIEVGYFDHPDSFFTIPKGLIVRDCSATGAGWFEPNRFTFVVTSDDEGLLDFDSVPPKSQELYSADRNPIGPTTEKPTANKPE